VTARIAALSRTGPAIGLRIYLLAAVDALLLAIGALLTASFVTARRRSYELAAVLALGGRRRTLVRAGRAEQLVLIVTGTGVGAAAGLVAVVLALPVLGAVTAGGPVRPSSIAWVPVVAVLVAVLGAAGLLAHLASRHVVALAGPDRLREVQG
jgi:putative ABC transport system permease protein